MSARGAYGLRLDGLPDHEAVDSALIAAPAHWPLVQLRLEAGGEDAAPDECDVRDDTISLALPYGGRAVFDRPTATATLTSPAPLTHDWLVHPALAFIGSVFSGWLGRCAFHAGAFVAGDGAWAILGDHECGKSSTLAWLAHEGHPVLADDMLVLDGLTAFAGPRSIDLRPATAGLPRFEGAAGVVRGGNRQRLTAPPTRAEYPLRGFFAMTWCDAGEVAVRELPASERLGALIANLHPVGQTSAAAVFDLVALPVYDVSRPKDLSSLPATAAELVRVAAAPADRAA